MFSVRSFTDSLQSNDLKCSQLHSHNSAAGERIHFRISNSLNVSKDFEKMTNTYILLSVSLLYDGHIC